MPKANSKNKNLKESPTKKILKKTETIQEKDTNKTHKPWASELLILISCCVLILTGWWMFTTGVNKLGLPPELTNTSLLTPAQPVNKAKPRNAPTFPVTIVDDKKNIRTLLDFYPSKTEENITYVVLSNPNNTYLIAISKDMTLRKSLLSKKLRVGQKVDVEVSKPIKFRKEPKEITELKIKLKKTTLVMLEGIKSVKTRNF